MTAPMDIEEVALHRPAIASVLLGLLSALCAAPAAAEPDPGALCRRAILAAERDQALPPGLLGAIAQVESGRPDPRTGAPTPWPWTINAEGQGRFFATKPEAVAAVQALQARGIRVVDVGCLQVNLFHHPAAFADLDQAFDPAANARYAADFLRRLKATRPSWDQAAANYHSGDPDRAAGYRVRVLAAWPAMAAKLAEERRREALVEAWAAARQPGANGFQAVALAGVPRPAAAAPARRTAAARSGRGPFEQVAEARR